MGLFEVKGLCQQAHSRPCIDGGEIQRDSATFMQIPVLENFDKRVRARASKAVEAVICPTCCSIRNPMLRTL